MNSSDIIGWAYQGALYCPDCKPDPESEGSNAFELWEYSTWERDAILDIGPVFADSETDTPNHCETCEALIPERLTDDGVAYVADALASGDGRAEVLALWRDQWPEVAAKVIRFEYGAVFFSDDFDAELLEDLTNLASSGNQYSAALELIRYGYVGGNADAIREHLEGSWEDEDLRDEDENLARAVWLLGCDLEAQGIHEFGC